VKSINSTILVRATSTHSQRESRGEVVLLNALLVYKVITARVLKAGRFRDAGIGPLIDRELPR